ncbi:hypothetical protein D3C73_1178430 [compost metagenome]
MCRLLNIIPCNGKTHLLPYKPKRDNRSVTNQFRCGGKLNFSAVHQCRALTHDQFQLCIGLLYGYRARLFIPVDNKTQLLYDDTNRNHHISIHILDFSVLRQFQRLTVQINAGAPCSGLSPLRKNKQKHGKKH